MELLKNSKRRTTSVQWPDEIDGRLDLLRRIAAAQGVQISRAQLLAALVASAPLKGPELAAIAVAYLQLGSGRLGAPGKVTRGLPTVGQPGRRRRTPE